MPFPTFSRGKANTFQARMQRARNEGYSRGAREAKLFRLVVGKVFERELALDWLSTAIDDGRRELDAQHALEREVEAWDMSCRIAFMVAITENWIATPRTARRREDEHGRGAALPREVEERAGAVLHNHRAGPEKARR